MPYQWDSVPAYRLLDSTVNEFLMELFGNYNFYTQVGGAHFMLHGILLGACLQQRSCMLELALRPNPTTSFSTIIFSSGSLGL